MPTWACKACVSEPGHGSQGGGWCGVGRHRTRERIEYHLDRNPTVPGADLSAIIYDEAAVIPVEALAALLPMREVDPALAPSGQLSLF